MAGLDLSLYRRLRGAVGRPRGKVTASPMFQALWARIEVAAKSKDPEVIANKNGFSRATWFEYRNKGTIPFLLLERVAAYLKLQLSVSVEDLSEVRGSTDAHQEGTILDYGKKLAQLIEEVPPEHQEAAFGAAFTAASAAIRGLPFDEPAAGGKASRSRSTKK